mgnify:FL=1
MKCQKCNKNEATKHKTFLDTVESYDYNGVFYCKECQKEFRQQKNALRKEYELRKEAPFAILEEILKLNVGEEWNLKLMDAEYLIKCIK